MRIKPEEFEKLFMEAVDEGLKSLGESGRHMVFYHLERSYSIKRQDIPKKPEAFAEGLKKIFGEGATVLEKIIIKKLYSKLGLKYENQKDYALADYIRDLETKKEARNNNEHSDSRDLSLDSPPPELKANQQRSFFWEI